MSLQDIVEDFKKIDKKVAFYLEHRLEKLAERRRVSLSKRATDLNDIMAWIVITPRSRDLWAYLHDAHMDYRRCLRYNNNFDGVKFRKGLKKAIRAAVINDFRVKEK